MEEWKDIPSYKGLYRVSTTGKVLSVRTGKLLIAALNRSEKGVK